MIYLDNAATTPMDSFVAEIVMQSMREDFANSGTVYRIGLDAKKKVLEGRVAEKVLQLITQGVKRR